MDPIRNPFTPGAGAPPPELAGRNELRENIQIALERIRRGMQSNAYMRRIMPGDDWRTS